MQLLYQLHNNELPGVQCGLGEEAQSGILGPQGHGWFRDSLLFPMRL